MPSGNYSTGYIHYPTYFFAAAGFHGLVEALTGPADLLSSFRLFSALTTILGVIACAVFAWLLGLRGGRFLAATALPVAASMLVFSGTIVNPSSISVLAGALIGGTGLLWIKRGKGFLWFALAVAFASTIAVTATLPAGGLALAMLIVLIGRRFGWQAFPDWRPRWWQLGVVAAIILTPVIVWGRVIAARATIDNDVLYGFLPPVGRKGMLVGAVREFATLHTPWRETEGIKAQPDGLPAQLIHAFSAGAPTWITVIVLGGIVIAVAFTLRQLGNTQPLSSFPPATFPPDGSSVRASAGVRLVAIGTLATLVLYPPALRISNWITFGFDYPIVERYSNPLAPLLVVLLLLLIPNRAFATSVAVIGTIAALGVVAGGF